MYSRVLQTTVIIEKHTRIKHGLVCDEQREDFSTRTQDRSLNFKTDKPVLLTEKSSETHHHPFSVDVDHRKDEDNPTRVES